MYFQGFPGKQNVYLYIYNKILVVLFFFLRHGFTVAQDGLKAELLLPQLDVFWNYGCGYHAPEIDTYCQLMFPNSPVFSNQLLVPGSHLPTVDGLTPNVAE